MASKKKEVEFGLVIIDGMNMANRFAWQHRTFTDSTGRPTGLFFGFFNLILGLGKKYPFAKIVVVWDSPQTKKRDMRPDYKADRNNDGKEDFYKQVRQLKDYLVMAGVDQAYAFGYEADDVAYQIVTHYSQKKEPLPILLYSNDTDWIMMLDGSPLGVYQRIGTEIFDRDAAFSHFRSTQNLDHTNLMPTCSNDIRLYLAIVGTHNNVAPACPRLQHDIAWTIACGSFGFDGMEDRLGLISRISTSPCYATGAERVREAVDTIRGNYDFLWFMPVPEAEIQVTNGEFAKEEFVGMLKSYDMKSLVARVNGE